MMLASAILAVLLLFFLIVLPVWPFSRGWGIWPALLIGLVFLGLLVMTFTGNVPG